MCDAKAYELAKFNFITSTAYLKLADVGDCQLVDYRLKYDV